jgi:hypothetical protein
MTVRAAAKPGNCRLPRRVLDDLSATIGGALKVVTVEPGICDPVRLEARPASPSVSSSLLVQALALGMRGTAREVLAFEDLAP